MAAGIERSTDAIVTTHTGNLPRPDDLVDLLSARENEQAVDDAELAQNVRGATAESVRQEIACGIDVVNDGEMSKVSYSTYVT